MDQSKTTPDLLTLVTDWWKASSYFDSFRLVDNRFSCKHCKIIFVKIHEDSVSVAYHAKGEAEYRKSNIAAADPKIFDIIADVFKNAKHDGPC